MINWGAVTAYGALVGLLLGVIRRGFELKQTLHEKRKADRAETRSAIETQHLVPKLADIVVQVATSIPPYDPDTETEDEYRYRVVLQLEQVAQITDVEDVTRFHSDHAALTDLERSAGRLGKRSAWAAILAMPGIVYWGFVMSWTDMPESTAFRIIAAVLAIGGLAAVALSWLQEKRQTDDLIDIYQKYELVGDDD